MNKLKEIGNKYYQEVDVVMLAIDKKAPFYLDKVIGLSKAPQDRTIEGLGYQHLYFISNEKIKEGDYYYNDLFNMVDQLIKEGLVTDDLIQTLNENKHNRKIIATTDNLQITDYANQHTDYNPSKYLPQPSQSFIQTYIKAYNENKPITKVLVEMEETGVIINKKFPISIRSRFELKVNSSNEITIKKVKDSYTREEVVELCKSAFITGTRENDIDYFEWERRNL